MTKWYHIETAPKDGTEILVFMDGYCYEALWEGSFWSFPFADYHGCGCCSSTNDQPTHWIPLPNPPTE